MSMLPHLSVWKNGPPPGVCFEGCDQVLGTFVAIAFHDRVEITHVDRGCCPAGAPAVRRLNPERNVHEPRAAQLS